LEISAWLSTGSGNALQPEVKRMGFEPVSIRRLPATSSLSAGVGVPTPTFPEAWSVGANRDRRPFASLMILVLKSWARPEK
jgi:hypothetical protein